MKQRDKIHFFILLVTFIILACSFAFADGFATNPELINEAAKSVMMLEIHSGNEVIATGSGFVAFDNRHLITNYHVIEGADMIWAYSDIGNPYIIMDVCVLDEEKDIAILQFFSPTDLTPLTLSETGEVLRASPVVAIGSPKGFKNTVSIGNVSFADREDGISYIQFTAPISSGSSGGALFDDNGNVVGITTFAIQGETGISQNMNFAINIREAVSLYNSWANNSEKQVYALQEMSKADIYTPTEAPTPINTPPTQNNATSKPDSLGIYDVEMANASFRKIFSLERCDFKCTITNNCSKKINSVTFKLDWLVNMKTRSGEVDIRTFDIDIESGETITTDWLTFTYVKDGMLGYACIESVTFDDGTEYVIPEDKKQRIMRSDMGSN